MTKKNSVTKILLDWSLQRHLYLLTIPRLLHRGTKATVIAQSL
jgi:hypothetical protein